MTFISYAQNFEDVMLWRALGHIEDGFYVDLGAWSPVQDSVTAAFYEAGWSGINVEPNPQLYAELVAARPRDINLACAVTEQQGQTELWLGDNSGLGCVQESDQAKTLAPTQRLSVACSTLNTIVAEHVPSGQSIHFLKIDIEGMEAAVINSTNWQTCRPWVVVVEAAAPMTLTPNFEAWEPTLLQADYAFVYSDGINRFYLAHEHSDLAVNFSHPPNYFDQFMLYGHHHALQAHHEASRWAETLEENARKQQKALESQLALVNQDWTTKFQAMQIQLASSLYEKQRSQRALAEARQAAQDREAALNERLAQQQVNAEARLTNAEHRLEETTATLDAIHNSTSWRVTGPLRALVTAIKRIKN